MRIYTAILLLSLFSIALKVNFQDVGSQSSWQLSSTDSDLLVSGKTGKPKDKRCEDKTNPQCQRGSGRREFFQLHQEETPLA